MRLISRVLFATAALSFQLMSKDRVIIIYESDSDDEIAKAKAEVELKVAYGKIIFALFEFKDAVGRHPTEAEGLNALITNPGSLKNWKGPYLDERYLKDPWKRRFVYKVVTDKVRIFSKGKTGKEYIDLELLLDGKD